MPDDETLNIKLRKLIETVDIANLLTEPLTSSIRDILAVSASEVGAREASVLDALRQCRCRKVTLAGARRCSRHGSHESNLGLSAGLH